MSNAAKAWDNPCCMASRPFQIPPVYLANGIFGKQVGKCIQPISVKVMAVAQAQVSDRLQCEQALQVSVHRGLLVKVS